MFNVFVLVSLFIVLSVCNLNNEVALFCVCVVCFLFFCNKTEWFCGLHLVVLFLSWLFFLLFHSFQNKRPKKPDTAKPPKTKNAEKKNKHKIQLAQLCSQMVFLIVWGWATKMWLFCWKHYKIVVSALFQKGKRQTINKIVELEICPRLSRKSVQLCCAT